MLAEMLTEPENKVKLLQRQKNAVARCKKRTNKHMFMELLGVLSIATVGYAVLHPRLQRHAVRSMLDLSRIATLACVDEKNIHFVVLESWRISVGSQEWSTRYRVSFTYSDLAVLVNGQANPLISLGDPIEISADTDASQLEAHLAQRIVRAAEYAASRSDAL